MIRFILVLVYKVVDIIYQILDMFQFNSIIISLIYSYIIIESSSIFSNYLMIKL